MVFNDTYQQCFSYIVAVSFIGGGRKPPTRRKSLTNISINVVSSTPRLRKMLVVIDTDCKQI
jgi:hypothetical protein